MLTAHGFPHVYNLTGGIKGWHSATAFGEEDQGLELFSGSDSADKSLIVAYALEQGLCEFYLSMIHKIENEQVRALFTKLANIEIKHQDRIFAEYLRLTGITIGRQDFEKMTVVKSMEGGLTTEEYINRFQPNFDAAAEVIGLAMGIEAQALDLYHRASQHTADKEGRRVLSQIAAEEQTHLHLLGQLMEQI